MSVDPSSCESRLESCAPSQLQAIESIDLLVDADVQTTQPVVSQMSHARVVSNRTKLDLHTLAINERVQ